MFDARAVIRDIAELAAPMLSPRAASCFGPRVRHVGVDASHEAIADGRKAHPSLELHEGSLANLRSKDL